MMIIKSSIFLLLISPPPLSHCNDKHPSHAFAFSIIVMVLLYYMPPSQDSNEKLKSCTTSWALFMFNLIRKSFTDPSAQCIYYLSNPLFQSPHTRPLLQILGPPLPRSTLFTKCSSQHAIHMTYQFDYLPVPVPGCLFLFLFGSSLPLPLLLLPDLLSPSSVACA